MKNGILNSRLVGPVKPIARSLVLWGRSIKYRGTAVHCPICDGTFSTFLPGGYAAKRRPNALCPGCRSLERHRLLWLYLQNKTGFFTDSLSVLHVAPENFLVPRIKKQNNIKYLTADLVRRSMVQMDITKIQYPENTFDVVLCSHVLEHIPEDRRAMEEIFRVLVPNGWAILQVPIDEKLEKTFGEDLVLSDDERREMFGHHDHKRQYGSDYKDRLVEAGFDVKVDRYIDNFSDSEIEHMGLNREESIYYCQKKQPVSAPMAKTAEQNVLTDT